MINSIIIAATSMLLLSSQDQSDVAKIRKNIYTSCIENLGNQLGKAGEDYCNCTADLLVNSKSVAELKQLESDIRRNNISQEDIIKMVQPCVDKLTNNINEDASTYTSIYRKNFIQGCIYELNGLANEDKVNDYCKCSADAIIEKLTIEEMQALEKNPDDTKLNAKLLDAISDCVTEFKK